MLRRRSRSTTPPWPDGWTSSPTREALGGIVRRRLHGVADPRVVVLARGGDHPVVALLRKGLPDAVVSCLDSERNQEELHLDLAVAGPFDLVLDLARNRRSGRRASLLVGHLAPGGALVVAKPAPARTGQPSRRAAREINEFRRDLAAAVAARDHAEPATEPADPQMAALAAVVDQVWQRDGHVVVTKRHPTLAKVRELDVNGVLARRPERGRVLATVPATTWESRCDLRASDPGWSERFPRTYDVPELSLREYDGVDLFPGQVAVQDGLVLPESYRHHQRRHTRSVHIADRGRHFAAPPEGAPEELAGPWFYLDNEFRGHFGHALTDQISHVWGWAEAKARHPSLRALVFLNRGRELAGWELDLWAAAGIAADDIVLRHRPARVETLVTASPMFSMPRFVHPGIVETYDRIGDALAARATIGRVPERIFCTRTVTKRSCHNTAEVETFFADRGFAIVRPEEHGLADQVALVRGASLVAGFAGSGTFQMAFAEGPKHVVLVSSDSYTAQNEYMMASVRGHRLDYVLCRADVPLPATGFSVAAYQSGFTFDAGREGVFLDRVLEDG